MRVTASGPTESTSALAQRLTQALAAHFNAPAGTEPNLLAVATGALDNPGRLFRDMPVWQILRSLGGKPDLADALAFGVEYFHLVSLLLDDVPCMDDSTIRHNRPCLHLQSGRRRNV